MAMSRPALVLAAVLLPLAACRKEEPTAYRIPKESEPEMPMAGAAGGQQDNGSAGSPNAGPEANMANAAVPTAEGAGLLWRAPSEWPAKPLTAMRKGSYAVPGEGGAAGDLSVTAFPGDVGGELANVNRWRGQVQLPPVDESGLAAVVERRELGGLAATVVDFGGAGAQRILGAIVPFGGATWFFKLEGPDALVEGAKPKFLAFLRTIAPAGAAPQAAPGSMAGTAVPTAQGSGLEWTAPAAWPAKPLSAMRKGSYAVHGAGGDADLSITAFPGDVGGELANVNRWRGQVQLPPIDDAGLAGAVERRQVHGLAIAVVDCGTPGGQRILGAMVPFGGATWFFKLAGPDAVVEGAKPGFLNFLETIRPAAPAQ